MAPALDGRPVKSSYRLGRLRAWVTCRPTGETVTAITLTFARFDTEDDFDVVRVFDGPNPMSDALLNPTGEELGYAGRLGKVALNQPLVASKHGSMLVRFSSDKENSGRGFLFGWTATFSHEAHEGECAVDCKREMRGDGHCDPACMNAACDWDRKSSSGEGDCERECAPGCRQEQLGNGVCEEACGSAACGFDAVDCSCSNVLTECEGTATDGSELTAHYNDATHRCWLLQPRRLNATIGLHWDRFDTEADHDFVRVYDGSSELDVPKHTARGYSGAMLPPAVRSSGGSLLIRFDSDIANAAEKGFRFSWSCTGKLLLQSSRDQGDGIGNVAMASSAVTPNLLTNPTMASAHSGHTRFGGMGKYGRHPDAYPGWKLAFPARAEGDAGHGGMCLVGKELGRWSSSFGATDSDGDEDDDSDDSCGFQVMETLSLRGTCCDITPMSGSMLGTSRSGFVREQTVDLRSFGFSTEYLDRAPPVYVGERFASLPPGLDDNAFLRVELLDEERRVLAMWQPSIDGKAMLPPQCSSACELFRAPRAVRGDAPATERTPFWVDARHTFTGYGPGLRYVYWRDGGRDDSAFSGFYGTLIEGANLTVALDAVRSTCALDCGRHGECLSSSESRPPICACSVGWLGEQCDVSASPACPLACSGHGTCGLRTDGRLGCTCDATHLGTYCTRGAGDALPVSRPRGAGPSVISVADSTSCSDGSTLRRGLDVALSSRTSVGFGSRDIVPEARAKGLPVVIDGVVLPDWARASAVLQSNATEEIDFSVSAGTSDATTVGLPTILVDKPAVLRTQFIGATARRDTQLHKGTAPLRVRLRCECIRPGVSTIQLSIPLPGYCTIGVRWTKVCTLEGMNADAAKQRQAFWVLVFLGLSICCCTCICKRSDKGGSGWDFSGPTALGLSPVSESGQGPLSRASLQYGAYGLWSRSRLAYEEVAAGRMRLSEVPAALRGPPRPMRQTDDDEQELQDML